MLWCKLDLHVFLTWNWQTPRPQYWRVEADIFHHGHSIRFDWYHSPCCHHGSVLLKKLGFNLKLWKQGSLYYQPKQCIVIREIPQTYHRFALFDSPKNGGNLMTPGKSPEEHTNKLWFVSACAENLSLSLRFHCTWQRIKVWGISFHS